MRKFILTFNTHFEALKALKQAKNDKTLNEAKLIAVPRKISSSCGTALLLVTESESIFSNFEHDKAFECLSDEEFIKID